MIINDDIRKAIKEYIHNNNMYISELGKKLGVSASTSTNWVNGTSSEIRNNHWSKIYPLIKGYLPDKYKIEATSLSNEGKKELAEMCRVFDSLDDIGRQKMLDMAVKELAELKGISEADIRKLIQSNQFD